MGNLTGFKAADYKEQAFDVLPAGDYDVVIVASELKTTKKGDGHYLELQLQVLSGQYQNRRLFDRLNIDNPNATCQLIGRGVLSAICRAVQVETPNDSAELHNKPLKAVVRVAKDDSGNPTNEIKGYKPRHVGPQAPVTPAASAPAPVPAQQLGPPLMTGPAAPRNPFAAS
jgi:hypothetical protein